MNINLAKELNECYVEYRDGILSDKEFAKMKGWKMFFFNQVINSGRKINHNQALLNIIYS